MMISIIAPESGTTFNLGSVITVKIASEAVQDAYTVLELALAPGQGAGLHIHHREDELLYVLEGVCMVGDADHAAAAGTGTIIRFARGSVHFFRNDGAATCRLLITAIPGGLDGYFTEVAAALAAGREEQISAINAKYQIEFLG